ncbi:MAG: pitrilysin family protein [Armatimonadota bacterium]|nr:pitrilysin family protein [Armatimonadota bacterium]
MEPPRKSVLPNGVRVVTEAMPQVRTASLGIWVGTGSRYEPASQHGISHFLEHLFFKGTHSRSALAIAQAVDALGGQMNAFTDKEHTCFYVKVLANHLPAIVELTADMLLNSAFDPEAIERERQVITEEIKTYEDSPDEVVQDLIAQTIWDGHPLGRSVIGTRKAVAKLGRDDFLRYIEKRYRADNIVVSVAGDIHHDAVVELVGQHFGTWDGKASVHPTEIPALTPTVSIRMKEIEQVHLCLATRGRAQGDDDRYTLAVLDNILGGGMSSRLFQEIREARGLVYTIASYAASYREGGLFVIYAAMSPENAPEVLRLTFEEIARLPTTLAEPELHRAKESLKGSLMLSLESTGSRMFKLGRSELYFGRQIDLDEIIGRVDAVRLEDVAAMTRELFAPGQIAMAAIGPFAARSAARADLERTFTESLSVVEPAPAATSVL